MSQFYRFGPLEQPGDGTAIIGVGNHHSFGISGGAARVANDSEVFALRWIQLHGLVSFAGFHQLLEVENGDAGFFGLGFDRFVDGIDDDDEFDGSGGRDLVDNRFGW